MIHANASAEPDIDPLLDPPPGNLYSKEVSASEWIGCSNVRHRAKVTGLLLASKESAAVRGRLERLERTGFMRRFTVGLDQQYALTDEGAHTLDWAGAPKPTFLSEEKHAAELARAIARYYLVPVHSMLKTGRTRNALLARARLCYALRARGWGFDRIRRHFAIEEAVAVEAVARWREERIRLAVTREAAAQ